MSSRVTLRDIAKDVGVSANTVSLAVRGSARVSVDTKERVLEAVRRLGYQPNAAAAALRSSRSGTIALLLARTRAATADVDVFRNQILFGVSLACDRAGQFLLQTSQLDVRNVRGLLKSGRVDGAIVDLHVPDSVLAEMIDGIDIPVVALGRLSTLPQVGWARADEHGGAWKVGQLLARRGGTVAVVSVNEVDHPLVRERVSGFQRGLEATTASAPPSIWYGDWSLESGRRAADEMIIAHQVPAGVFVLNELMAAGVLERLIEQQCRVPVDIQIATVEDSKWVEYVRPSLTAVHVPMDLVAETATNALFEMIEGAEPCRITIPTQLVERDSTASRP